MWLCDHWIVKIIIQRAINIKLLILKIEEEIVMCRIDVMSVVSLNFLFISSHFGLTSVLGT
jgi:hypothetical protein